ncbi:restriction endonuclease subunit S [Mesorhizobium sp. M0663]|uniref:restriction endonuclease subunit S n=1 Tax=Mesorhizobium sp. M0663 TaxID=2956981 RepID=UPI00333948BB
MNVELGNHAHITKLAGFEYTNHFDYSVGGEIIALRSMNIRDGRLDLSDVQTMRIEVSDALPRSKLRSGDIVLGYVGSKLGNLAKINEDNRFHLAPNVALIRPSRDLLADYLLQFMLGPIYQSKLWSFAGSTGQPALSMANIRRSKIWLPPLPEQKKIAEILSTWDVAIGTTEKLLANAEAQKLALMQQLLTGKRRLKGFEGKAWRMAPIASVAKEVSDRNRDGDEFPVVSCSKTLGFVNSLEYFKKQVFSDDLTGYKLIRRGQIGYPANHVEEGSIGLQNLHEIALVSPIYTVFETASEMDSTFLFRVLKTDHYRQLFAAATNASVDRRGSLRWKAFSIIKVPVPTPDEQHTINNVLGAATKEIEAISAGLSRLRLEKFALMQQLLTGKRQVMV